MSEDVEVKSLASLEPVGEKILLKVLAISLLSVISLSPSKTQKVEELALELGSKSLREFSKVPKFLRTTAVIEKFFIKIGCFEIFI